MLVAVVKTAQYIPKMLKVLVAAPDRLAGAVKHAALGNKEEAIRWLETAYQEHAVYMVWLKTDPQFDNLRLEPRFRHLLRRMNFPT